MGAGVEDHVKKAHVVFGQNGRFITKRTVHLVLMDTLFHTIPLDTLTPSIRESQKLTGMVNGILLGDAKDISREDVATFCRMLLVGDDMSTLQHKSLPYVARTNTTPPKVVMVVVKVKDNLEELLVDRETLLEKLIAVENPVMMLQRCLQMIIHDPREYKSFQTDMTQFTYKEKSKEEPHPSSLLSSTSTQSSTPSSMPSSTLESSPKRTRIDNDSLEGASLLYGIKMSPPRVTQFASPAREVFTTTSVMSDVSPVMKMTPNSHRKSARVLEECFK